ncbi:MAG: hypothetical protein IPM20_01745 [Gammaproteobacteria bacterium]|nr:hypothetical protein [Gammaproteobacteria bacterium]
MKFRTAAPFDPTGHWAMCLRGTLVLLTLLACAAPVSQVTAAERREQAGAQFPKGDLGGFTLQRKDFRFNRFTAWLKRDGTWHVEGEVQHRGLMCGTYEVGMRFGVGTPDCTDVNWVSQVRYVTSKSQCNEAILRHSGTEVDMPLSGNFEAVTCGEVVVRCSGNCK